MFINTHIERTETGLIEDIHYRIENVLIPIGRIINRLNHNFERLETVVVFDGDVIHRGRPLSQKNAHNRILRRLKQL